MKEPIIVEMMTTIRDGDLEETIEFSTTGFFVRKGSNIYLQFKENLEEEKNISQLVKVDLNKQIVTVLRQGDVSMKQLFLINKKTEGVYRSQIGSMLMETRTDKVYFQIDEAKTRGKIELTYQLHLAEQFAGTYLVTITFRRKT